MALTFPDKRPNSPLLTPEEANAIKALVNANETAAAALVVTVQAADPTSASDPGWYAATGSGDLFYKSDAGLFTIAGSYAADE